MSWSRVNFRHFPGNGCNVQSHLETRRIDRVNHSFTCMEMNFNFSEFLRNQCLASCPDLF